MKIVLFLLFDDESILARTAPNRRSNNELPFKSNIVRYGTEASIQLLDTLCPIWNWTV